MKKKEEPSPLVLARRPTPHPLPFPRPSQAQKAAAQLSPRASIPLSPSTGKRVPCPVSLPGGTQRSGSSPTSVRVGHESSRTHRARFARGVSISPDSRPLNTRPDVRYPPNSSRAAAVASNSPKLAAEIRLTTNPPLQRVPSLVSSLPVFLLRLRSRRNLLFSISCTVLNANPRRTSLQSRSPPFVVASPSRPFFVAALASGEFATSF